MLAFTDDNGAHTMLIQARAPSLAGGNPQTHNALSAITGLPSIGRPGCVSASLEHSLFVWISSLHGTVRNVSVFVLPYEMCRCQSYSLAVVGVG